MNTLGTIAPGPATTAPAPQPAPATGGIEDLTRLLALVQDPAAYQAKIDELRAAADAATAARDAADRRLAEAATAERELDLRRQDVDDDIARRRAELDAREAAVVKAELRVEAEREAAAKQRQRADDALTAARLARTKLEAMIRRVAGLLAVGQSPAPPVTGDSADERLANLLTPAGTAASAEWVAAQLLTLYRAQAAKGGAS